MLVRFIQPKAQNLSIGIGTDIFHMKIGSPKDKNNKDTHTYLHRIKYCMETKADKMLN